MKQDFTIEIISDNNFSVLNRIINILNRRRVRIKKLMAHELEDDFRKGGALLLVHATEDMMERVKDQLEKLIEVERVTYTTGSAYYFEKSEQIVDVD
jgi:acetolactate synthase small subunit